MEEETLYEVTVTASFTEQFDRKAETEEEAEEYAEFTVKDDIRNGVIGVDALDIEATAEEVEA